MSVCYSVECNFYFRNLNFIDKLVTFLEENITGFKFKENQNFAKSELDNLMEILLCANNKYSNYEKHSDIHFSSDFEQSYCWENILIGAFNIMSKSLFDGSYMCVFPDNYCYKLSILNGIVINTGKAEIYHLSKKNLKDVNMLDTESGFNVSQWLEDLEDEAIAENCYGIFYENEIIGYCTLGDADGCINVDTNSNDKLLSDVYIKLAWRHKFFATILINEILENIAIEEVNCFIALLDDGLKNFYENFGFIQYKNSDNIMFIKRED